MVDLTERLESIVRSALEDMDTNVEHDHFEAAFEKYKNALQSPLALYRDHSATSIPGSEALRNRFQYETALLHVITHALSYDLFEISGTQWKFWPAKQPDSFFSWYDLRSDLCSRVDEIAIELVSSDNFRDFISEVSQHLRDKTSEHDLGEYYTPTPIVEHLIDASGFEPGHLIAGKRVIDPACGSGIVLISIAKRVVAHCQCGKCSADDALLALSHHLFGFDVQPIAVALAKSLLVHVCSSLLATNRTLTVPDFSNIRLVDTLTTDSEYWQESGYFHYVIGNPPFVSVKKEHILHANRYEEILFGHPNLYQLFLWWAVKATVPGGKVSFVLPQSVLIGIYSKRLRERLSEITTPITITRMIDRYGVVPDADQQMMVVSLEVRPDDEQSDYVAVRVTRNGNDIHNIAPTLIPRARIVQNVASSTIWVVSDKKYDYSILERLESKSSMLSELNDIFQAGNGSFVWNQHKGLLSAEQQEHSIPLISAASISPYVVGFPYTGNHVVSQRMFARVSEKVKGKQYSGNALLVQRTTPRKAGRRIVAGILPDKFHSDYPAYFLENHVNYVQLISGDNGELLQGLNGWLNSDIVNFTFQLRNGTAHLSLFELNLLPVVPQLLLQIAIESTNIVQRPPDQRHEVTKVINETIFDWLGVGRRHQQRIEQVMQIQERANHS